MLMSTLASLLRDHGDNAVHEMSEVEMFKFGGWKASLNLSGIGRRREVYDNGPDLSTGGAYRSHREEFFEHNSITEPPKKLTPSMVKLPPSKETIKTSKSASDLKDPYNLPPQLRKSTPDVSTDPRGEPSDNRGSTALHKDAKKNAKDDKKDTEKKKAEKRRLAEEKKKAQEQAKQDKLRIQREKKIAEQQAKNVKARKKESKKALPQASVTKSLVPEEPQKNPLGRVATNTLESSISRSSGPPPYTEEAIPQEKQINENDSTGNTSFNKPIENSSWDLISEHRSQINRNPVASGSKQKQMVLDLQLSLDKAQANDRNNSEV
ncbi:kinesin-related protein 12-like [Cydia strobilella]|uniref:kinesin-related protein 12-like n=1 Tax=Cydia strobilella TaxID=1100964 RepID=UPI0030054144